MSLSSPIRSYFAADDRNDDEALIRAFASDAMVKDEGQTHAGHQAIGAWWRETKDRYRTVLEPLEADGEAGLTRVRVRVTGQFPGSPVTLTFTFRTEGERISRLEIVP